MNGARSTRKARPLSSLVIRARLEARIVGVLIMVGASSILGVAAYCALGYDAANVTADPAAYAKVIVGVAGLGAAFFLAGVVTFAASWSIR